MRTLEMLILVGGVLHFGILLASALVPKVLNWTSSLASLDRLSRQLIWVHGAFIVLVIIGFGLISILYPAELAAGSPLDRGVCLFIAVFWAARLLVQFFVFDARPFLATRFLRAGYHGLTVVFTYHVCVYCWAALHLRW
jgi:hypothetical protein